MKKLVNRLNNKGQDLSIGTLILIVLGIVVLVLLILGFSMGWGNLWQKIDIFGGTASINDVVTKTFEIKNIVINNAPPNKTVKLLTNSITIKVRGLAADLGAVNPDNIIAAIDLVGTNNNAGRFTVPVKFEIPQGINAGVSGEYTAVISVK